MKGTEKKIAVQGNYALLFISGDGTENEQLAGFYGVIGSESRVGSGKAGEEVLLEALAVPDLTMDGYMALGVFSTSMAISPVNGRSIELTVTTDQPYAVNEPAPPQN